MSAQLNPADEVGTAQRTEQDVPLLQQLEINALEIRETAKYSVCLQ